MHTLRAAGAYFPIGSGLGSFEKVYPLYEEETSVEPTYVNHAHNDYLEILLEFGLAGVVLIAAGLALFFQAGVRVWRGGISGNRVQETSTAAFVAISVVLIHSLVDYPLRTEAIACVVAACVAILIRAGGAGTSLPVRAGGNDLTTKMP